MNWNSSAIVGGIDALDSGAVATVVSGGRELIVGGAALDAMRDRALYLSSENANSMESKKLLDIIGMSQPVTFGVIQCDDGESSFIIARKNARAKPEAELFKTLAARLEMPLPKVADQLAHEFGLNRPMLIAMGEAVNNLVERIDKCVISRGQKTIRPIMIAPALGELVPFAKPLVLEVESRERKSEPETFDALITLLLDLAVRKKCVAHPAIEAPKLELKFPKFPKAEIGEAARNSPEKLASVYDYVSAIIMRENALAPHLAAIEQYYVDIAHGIQAHTKRIDAYLR